MSGTASRPAPSKCCILVPSRNGVDPACEAALRELGRRGYHLRYLHGATSIDQIRSQMATDALEAGYQELFWIDDDIVFDPDDVDQLRASGLPVIGGVYPKKGERQFAVRWADGTGSVVLGERGVVVEVRYAAAGFLLTHASVYQAIQATLQVGPGHVVGQFGRPMIPYFQPMTVDDGGTRRCLAEDWSFCHRCSEAGIPIMVDTRPRLLHVGRYAYSWDDMVPRDPIRSLTIQID